ncbi:IMS-domain-containing protein [Lanmaoa asiatica]|nr:IMS-domain-containing protein [Lanmaoa asiatica]
MKSEVQNVQQSHPEPSQESASLLKRLAGPSSTKAGLVQDQNEINRIIAEVSKGSKFYEASIFKLARLRKHEKDKELSEKITKILKQREEALDGVDISVIERQVDHIIEELEDGRDLSQTIVHVDMDAFYASVELLDDPSLEGKPFGVGGGVLSTASYEARKYGVRSGMAEFVARKLCPDLIVVKLNFGRYSEMSERCMRIFRRYDPNMLAAGCDEGYLNVTQYCTDHQIDAETCVREMRAVVHSETQLTVSAGIAPNKCERFTILAEFPVQCLPQNKPNGQFHLSFDCDSIKMFMHDLSIRKVPGVGRVHERLLDAIGIKNCGDIYTHRATLYLMDKQFGLRFLLKTYLGIASNVVEAGRREERKSIGAERTFRALSDKHMILSKLEDVAEELARDMASGGWTGKTVTLKYKLDTYQVFTRAKSFDRWVSQNKADLFAIGKELLLAELPLTIRLIGLRITKLKDLHAAEPVDGIKRFFGTLSSPQKRVKLEVDMGGQPEPEGEEDSMPGFYEEEELELDYLGHDKQTMEGSEDTLSKSQFKPRSGINVPSPLGTSSKDTVQPFEASGSSLSGQERTVTTAEHHTCPICSKQLKTDNQGLNAHIDFCLSKGAILEAQAEASTPKKPGQRSTVFESASKKRKR